MFHRAYSVWGVPSHLLTKQKLKTAGTGASQVSWCIVANVAMKLDMTRFPGMINIALLHLDYFSFQCEIDILKTKQVYDTILNSPSVAGIGGKKMRVVLFFPILY